MIDKLEYLIALAREQHFGHAAEASSPMASASTCTRLSMSPDKLVYMANQIGKYFVPQGEEKAVAGIANHLVKFWDPRMRSTMLAHLEAGGAGLDPLVRKAVESLKETAARR
jgi:formate dehydrogenase subunit delta